MPDKIDPRRRFLKVMAGLAAAGPAFGQPPGGTARVEAIEPRTSPARPSRIRFGVIGLNHGHIHGQISAVERGGGELASFYAREDDLAQDFARRYPLVRQARSDSEILEDPTLQLVVSASIPDERAPLGIRAMLHGKDFLADKPGATSLEQLAEVRRSPGPDKADLLHPLLGAPRAQGHRSRGRARRGWSHWSRRSDHWPRTTPNERTATAGVVLPSKPVGGILTDIASHQADQFLFFTGSTRAEVVASQVGNTAHRQYSDFEDFGDVMLAGDGGVGYIRVDWLTPDGLGTWGDGRLTILGTEGFIEIRKNVDLAGRPEGNHLFLVDRKETRYVDCRQQELPFGERFVSDIVNRTETAMPQDHCFLATDLVLRAQKQARRIEV